MLISFNCENIFFIFLFIFTTNIISYIGGKYLDINYQKTYPSISQSILIIFYFIEKKLSKINKKYKKNLIQKKKTKKYQIYKKYMIIFSSIVFYFIFYYINLFILKNNDYLILRKNTQICFFLLIDFIFFKHQRYSHQILSIIIIIVFTIILFIIDYNKLNYITFILLLCNYSYAFSFLIVKYINTKYFISVYIFGFIFGLLEIILLLIKGISFQFTFDLITILYFIGLIGNNYLFYYIIYKLSPTYSIICQCISILIIIFIDLNENIIISLTIIGIIFGLIYLEIIELNFCNLNKNLKKNIFKRGENEDIIILENIINSTNTSIEN